MGRLLLLLIAIVLALGCAWLFSRGDLEGEPAAGPRADETSPELAPPAVEPHPAQPTPGAVAPAPRQAVESPPATASLEVHLLDPAGLALVGVQVELQLATRDLETGAVLELASTSTEDGTQHFHDLPAAMPLVVRAQAGYPWSPGRVRIASLIEEPGPVELVLDYTGLILFGRAVDERDQPLAKEELRPILSYISLSSSGGIPWSRFSSDTEGRFVQRLAGGLRARTMITGTDPEPPQYRLELWARESPDQLATEIVEIPDERESGVLDLGDLAFSPLPVLAAGRVVDEGGQPVRGARVWAYAPHEGLPGQIPISTRPDGSRMRFFPEAEPVESAEDGSFAVRSSSIPSFIEVHASHADYIQASPVDCSPGSTALELELVRGGYIEGCFAGLSADERDDVWLSLSEPGGEFTTATDSVVFTHDAGFLSMFGPRGYRQIVHSRDHGREFGLTREGAFWFGPLPPDRYSLRVRIHGSRAPTLLAEDLEVRPGGTNRDERLQDIALDELLSSIELLVVDGGGRRQEEGFVLVGRDGAYDSFVRLGSEPLTIRVAQLPVDLLIRARGCAEQLVEDVHEDREVVLEPGWPVQLCLPPALVIPDGWSLYVEWRDQRYAFSARERLEPQISAWFDDAGRADIVAPHTGWVPMRLRAMRRVGDGTYTRSLHLPGKDNRVEVLDVQGTQEIELPLSSVELEKLRD